MHVSQVILGLFLILMKIFEVVFRKLQCYSGQDKQWIENFGVKILRRRAEF